MGLYDEIQQQPGVLQRLIDNQAVNIETIARAINQSGIRYVFLAARGTSDNAGLYAKYLLGSFNRLPIALATPSLFSLYGTPPLLKDSLVVGISQSGQSPDINCVLEEGKHQGALTLAITNSPGSPLGQQADFLIDISAGAETSVAATKTYTAQLLSIALLSAALRADAGLMDVIRRTPELAARTLQENAAIQGQVERYTYMTHCVVLGRGYNYATAFEWSLKLKELSYVIAEPYSSADFQHGPIAIVEPRFPVLAVMPSGMVYADMLRLLEQMHATHKVELVIISNEVEALKLANTPLVLPADVPEWISPVVSILPAQLFCYYLTLARGFDPDSPRGLRKVTETW